MSIPNSNDKLNAIAKKLVTKAGIRSGVEFVTPAPTEDQDTEQTLINKSNKKIKDLVNRVVQKALNATTVQQGNIQEYKTTENEEARKRSRSAQRSRKHNTTDKKNVLPGLPEPEQGVPSNRRYKEKNPSSKIKPVIVDSYNSTKQLVESYDLNIAKPAGYGTFMTAKDMGIKIKAGFALHPSVEEEIEERNNVKMDKKDI